MDEQWECWTLCAIEIKARTGGGKGRHLWPRLVQKIAEGKTYELLRVELESKSNGKKVSHDIIFPRHQICLRVQPTTLILSRLWFFSVSTAVLLPQNLYLSRMKNQQGHWGYCWCRWVERTVWCEDNSTKNNQAISHENFPVHACLLGPSHSDLKNEKGLQTER